MEAAKAIERKQKKDQRDRDAPLLVEERLLKQKEKQEKDKKRGQKTCQATRKGSKGETERGKKKRKQADATSTISSNR
jgi:hypothetical protein